MSKTIADQQAEIVAELTAIKDWKERYKRIIEKGKQMPEFPEEHRVDKNKVKGCQSQVWLHAWLHEGRLHLVADSDAAIVRGLVAILLDVFDYQYPDDVIAADIGFLDEIGLSENLSQTRSNGLMAMIKQIKLYATVFNALKGN